MVVELNGDIEAFSFFLNIFKDIRHLSFPTLKILLVLDFFLGFWHQMWRDHRLLQIHILMFSQPSAKN
ncbi:hypothetical protein EP1X_05910 [Thermococcus sp. EP1]|nr:hypothetical protein EP1X_05910 [Thermococcus sp. EP1]